MRLNKLKKTIYFNQKFKKLLKNLIYVQNNIFLKLCNKIHQK